MKNITRVLLLFTFFLFSISHVFSQNNNGSIDAAGDIAFVAFHDNDDGFSFVFLDDCPNGTVIRFIDEGWTGSGFASASSEGEVTWTNNTGSAISKGVVIDIVDADDNLGGITASQGTASETDSGFTTGVANEQIYAVTGTRAAPGTFLAFVGNASIDGSTSITFSGTGLTAGSTALSLGDGEGYYTGSSVFNGSLNNAASTINTAGNWTVAPFSYPAVVPDVFTGSAFSSNNAPTDISLSPLTKGQSTLGVNATFGTLSSTDADGGDSHTYTLVSGSGDTDNGNFNISGSTLRTNGGLITGTHNIRINTNDGTDDFAKALTVTVTDDFVPTFNSAGSTPIDGATGIATANNIVVDFSENIAAGTGNITIRDVSGSTNFEVFAITGATATSSPTAGNIGILNDKLYINPTSGLADSNNYAIRIDATAIDDANGNSFAGITDDTTFNFTTADETAPSFDATPTATSIAATTLTLNADINETGDIFYVIVADGAAAPTSAEVRLGQASGGGSPVKSGNAGGAFSGTDHSFSVTGLTSATAYDIYVVGADPSFNIQASPTLVNATTLDNTPPTYSTNPFPPTINATSILMGLGINEAGHTYYVVLTDGATAPTAAEVKAGTGSGGAAEVTKDNAAITDSGGGFTHTFTVGGLTGETAYDIYVISEDSSGNLQTTPFLLEITTADETNPTLNSSSPTDGATAIATDSNIVLTFDENIAFGTGNIQVIDVTDGSNSFTINAASPGSQASISGAVLTINPSSNLDSNSNYAIQIAATAIDDSSGNSFSGITNNTTLDFTTASAPTVTTTTASSVTSTSVLLAGNISTDGGASVTERGYVYSITAYNSNPLINGTGVFKGTDGTGTGAFTETITDLIAGTSYSYKAYATNSSGTSYGTLQTFTTPVPSTFPHTITFNLGIVAGYNMTSSTPIGEFTFSFTSIDANDFISPDIGTNPKGTSSGSLYDSNITPNDITKWTISKTDGTEFKLTSLVLKDSQVGASTSGTIKAYKDGSQVGSTVNIDFDGLKNLSANTDFENIDQIQIEATDINFFIDDFTYAEAIIANTAPTVSTTAASSITTNSATLAGNVTADGGVSVTERGIVYSITTVNADPLISGAGVTKDTNGTGTGVFSESISSLTAGTQYSYKAYAINTEGTTYGNTTTFTTTAPSVTLGVSGSPLAENGGVATVTATLSAASSQTVTVTIAATGTATSSGTDYNLSSTTITINAGATTGTATITGVDDALDELAETVIIDITGVTNGTESGTQQVTATITDDDAAPTVTLGVSGSPLAENGGVATVTATLSAASSQTVTVTLGATGTATSSGTDYNLSSTTITINAGATTGTATITGVDDALDELAETVIIDITGVTNGTESGTQQVTATITDDDAAPSVSLGLSGSPLAENGGVATVTATLSAISGQTVTVTLGATGTATGSGTDYNLSSTTITINAGATTGTATITGVDDALDELAETVIIDITGVTNGTESGTQQVTATITDDDAAPSVTLGLSGSPLAENGGVATVTATLSAISGQTVTVTLGATGTATGSGTDYNLSSTTITINAGATTGTATITGVDDALDELAETVIIDITGVTNGTESGTQQVTATITDDDAAPSVSLGISGSPLAENGGVATVTATLSAASSQTVTVILGATGTATSSGTDYNLSSTTITINAGATTGTATITGVDDALDELAETVIIDITGVTNGTESGTQQVTATITDDDAAPSVSLGLSGSPLAENGGVATITATLSAISGQTVTVTLGATGTATGSGTDYNLSSTTITINAGATTGTATITGVDDALDEITETVIIDITGVTNGTESGTQQVTATITDDDAAPSVSLGLSGSPLAENGGVATITATLSAISGQTVTVTLGATGTATGSGTDYNLSSTTITINAGATTGTATITGVDDALDEITETVIIDITGVTNGTESGTQQVTASITDDDDAPSVSLALSGSPLAENGGFSTIIASLSTVSSQTVTVTLGTSGTATGSGVDYTLSSTTITINAGSISGTASITGVNDAAYEAAETVVIDITGVANGTESGAQQVTATITDDDLIPATITFVNVNKTYGDANFDLGATSNSTGTISYSIISGGTGTASLSGTNNETVSLGNAGTVTLRATLPADGAYSSATKDITLTIEQKTITVTADPLQKKVSGDIDPSSYTYQITSGSLVSGDTFSGALTRAAGETVGNHPIQIGTLTLGANYNLTFISNDFIIDVVVTTGYVDRSTKSVTVTGNVSSLLNIVERGVVYSASDTTPELGEPGVIQVADDTTTGPFIVEITDLHPSTTYYFQTYIITGSGGLKKNLNGSSTFYGGPKTFTTLASEPNLVSKNPTNGTLKVDPKLTISLNFDVDVQVGTGNILIKKTSDDSLIETIDVTSGNITIKNNIVQINPTADLPQKTEMYVVAPLGSVRDLSANSWTGLVNKTDWTFTTDDTTDPTVTSISPLDNAIDIAPSDDLTVTFSEDIVKGTGNILVKKTSDDTVIATLDVTSSEISISNNIVTINPSTDLPSETDMYIQVPNTAFKDLYDNAYAGFTDKTIWNFTTADITAPTVTITSTRTNYTNTPFTATFTFSEDIKNFDLSDITIVNAAASIFNKINDAKYTALITPASEGDVTVSTAADELQDLSNNNNTASNIFSIKYDITKPSLVITSDTTNPTNVSSFVASFTFSEGMDEFDPSYFTVTNATVSNFITVNDAVFKATITPIIDGSVTINVAEDETEDYAGNENSAAQYITVIDTVKPTVTVTGSVANPTNIPFTATFTFSEDVTGFEIGDITLGNAIASNFAATSSSVYTALITPTTDGNTTIDVAADVANDAATNGNTAASQFSVLYDNTKPTISISSATANPTNNTFTAIFTFSESVSNFVVGDIDVTNATISNFTTTSSSVYSALITPTVDGNVTIDVAADVAADAATNNNTAATQFSMLYDTTKPTIVISSPVANPTNSTFTATFTFSEAVSNFEITDITLGNATASNFAATSSSVYTALITPITDGTVTIDVAADVANDAAMNKILLHHNSVQPMMQLTQHLLFQVQLQIQPMLALQQLLLLARQFLILKLMILL